MQSKDTVTDESMMKSTGLNVDIFSQAFEHFMDMNHETQTALMKENADLVVR